MTGAVLALAVLFNGHFQRPVVEVERRTIPPPPRLSLPNPVTLPKLNEAYMDMEVDVSKDINAILLENCTLEIWGIDGTKITNNKFINSKIRIHDGSKSIEISNNIIRDHYVHEDPAIAGAFPCGRGESRITLQKMVQGWRRSENESKIIAAARSIASSGFRSMH